MYENIIRTFSVLLIIGGNISALTLAAKYANISPIIGLGILFVVVLVDFLYITIFQK